MRTAEVVVPGERRRSVVLLTHLGHSAMANDGLSGIAVGIEALRLLRDRSARSLGVRLVIGPEGFVGPIHFGASGGAGEDVIAVLALDGLARDHAPVVAFGQGSERLHRVWSGVLGRHAGEVVSHGWSLPPWPWPELPLVALWRAPAAASDAPYPEHHSSADTAGRCSPAALSASADLVVELIDALEGDLSAGG